MRTTVLRGAAALATIAALTAPAPPASADPDPANPAPFTGTGAVPGPAGAADPPPADGAVAVDDAPPVDDGKVPSSPPATMTAADGVTLRISAEDEIEQPIAPLTTAISTREYLVGGIFRGALDGSDAPRGSFEVGYQIGCGIDMGTGPGVLIGGNLGANASYGLLDGSALGAGLIGIPNAGITGGGSVTVSLKPGVVNTLPVVKKLYKGEAPRVSIRNFRVRIDGCVGESFIRSYAVLARSTDQRETILSWYGVGKRV